MTARTGQVRIIGGKWKGRKLSFPATASLRPTPARLRETLFAWLGDSIERANCLDLCAGSGALGIESLSRGAAQVDLVEKDRRACEALRVSLRGLEAKNAQVWCQDARRFVALSERGKRRWDIVFLDPPFASGLLVSLFPKVFNLLESDSSRLCVEQAKNRALPEGPWRQLRASVAGDTSIRLFAHNAQADLPPV